MDARFASANPHLLRSANRPGRLADVEWLSRAFIMTRQNAHVDDSSTEVVMGTTTTSTHWKNVKKLAKTV